MANFSLFFFCHWKVFHNFAVILLGKFIITLIIMCGHSVLTPLVTIGIPMYNVENYIEKSLLSVLSQTYQNIEILVVDDCSTDSSADVVRRLQTSHPFGQRISLITQLANQGVSEARNSVIAHAKGKYIYFVDSDDFIEPDTIEKMLIEAEENETDVVIASSKTLNTYNGKEENFFVLDKRIVLKGKDALAEFFCQSIKYHIPGTIWNILYSATFLQKNGLQFYGRRNEDARFLYDYYHHVESAVLLPDITYIYVLHPGSIMGYQERKAIPAKEIRASIESMCYLTERSKDVKDKPYYDMHCAKVLSYKKDVLYATIRNRALFDDKITNQEIRPLFAPAASFKDILRFKHYRLVHILFYVLWKLPPSISIPLFTFVMKAFK